MGAEILKALATSIFLHANCAFTLTSHFRALRALQPSLKLAVKCALPY